MNDQSLPVAYESRALPATAAQMRAHVNLIQEVMQAVMKDGTHFGKIPGTPKPSLWKPGAEVLCTAFHIAPSYRIEDLSGPDFVRYRIVCLGTHQASGVLMGEGAGEASSLEEKYKWRKAVSNSEFDATAEDRRRLKYGYDRQDRKEYTTKQVRTEAADVANTILKMACKRAQVAMTLNVTAASDIFTQDIEDLPEHLCDAEVEAAPARTVDPPQAKSAGNGNGHAPKADDKSGETPASEGQIKMIHTKAEAAEVTEAEILKEFKLEKLEGISVLTGNCILQFLKDPAGYRAKQ